MVNFHHENLKRSVLKQNVFRRMSSILRPFVLKCFKRPISSLFPSGLIWIKSENIIETNTILEW